MDIDQYKVKPGKRFQLSKYKTKCEIAPSNEKSIKEKISVNFHEIAKFNDKLFAENRQSLLIILQGMDSSGKDGTIKQIMRELNPQGVVVHSFKHPSTLELEHDYLWRHSKKLPEHGQVAIFNRSHYENVLISKVHPELILFERLPGIFKTNQIKNEFWNKRYEQINYFEKNTVHNGTHILKFFLHLSKEEQRIRFLDRIENKEKFWKFSPDDIAERNYWKEYQHAYESALKNTSTKNSPWYVIPADNKLSAHLIISKIILKKFKSMNPVFPPINIEEKELMSKAKKQLKKEK
jgi:PPK2 family polyphosphate:nucleotide phosphotransferase